jgi:hypothetical protein
MHKSCDIFFSESILFSQPTTESTASRVTLNSLNDIINGSLNNFKLNLTYLYKENSDKLTQLISSNETFSFTELTKYANPKDYANLANKIKLMNKYDSIYFIPLFFIQFYEILNAIF